MDENVEPLWGELLDDPAAIEPIPPRIYRSCFDVTTKDQQRGWKKSDIVSPNLKSSDVGKATETSIFRNKKSGIIPFKEISKNQENKEPLWEELLEDPATIEPGPPRIYRNYFDGSTKDQQRGLMRSVIVSPNLKSSDVGKATETSIFRNKKSGIIPFKEISKNQENKEPLGEELLEDPATIEPGPPRIYRNYFDGSTKDQQRGLMRSVIVSPNLKSSDVGKAMETTSFSNQKSGIIPFKEICKNQVFVCKQQILCATEMEHKQNSSITGLQHHIGGIMQACAATARATGALPPLVRLKKPDPPKSKTTRGGVSNENGTNMMVFSSLGNEKGKPTRAKCGAASLVPLKKPDPPERKTTRGGVSNENATNMMVFSSLGNEKGKPTRAKCGAASLVPLKKPDPPERKTTRGGVSDENATQMMVFSCLGNEKGKPTRANCGIPPLVPLKKPDPSKRKTIMLVPLKKPDPPERRTTRGGASDENAAQMMIISGLGNEKGKPKEAVSDTMVQQKGRAKRPVLTNLKCNIGPEMEVKMTDLCAGMKKGREKRPALYVDTHNGAGTTLVVSNKRRATLREVPNVLSDGVLTGAPPLVRVKKPDPPKRKTTRVGVSDENATQMMVFSCPGNEKKKPTRANVGVPPLVPLKKPDPLERKTTRGVVSDENAAPMMLFSILGNEKGKPKDAVSDTMGQQKGRAKGPVLANVKCNIGPEMKVRMTDLCASTKKGRGKRPPADVDTHNGAGTSLVVPNKRRATLREVPNILSDGILTGAHASVMTPDTINGDTTSSGIVNIDCEKSNILMCCIYASDIYSNFRANELIGRPSSDFLERLQTDVTQNKRAVLMDWLVEVCQEYSLVPDTLHLTVNLIDRFLSMNKIERQRLQLLGVTCMLIASKYEEKRAPHVRDLCLLTCNSYNENEVLQMERQVLSVVGYNLSVPTIKTFLRRFLRAALASFKAQPELMYLTNYLAELALVEYSFLEFLPSMIAAAAVFLGQWNLDQSTHPWNKTLAHYTGYKSSDMKKCILALRDLQVNTKNCPLKAIRFKYWHDKYSSVAYQTSPELPDYLFC